MNETRKTRRRESQIDVLEVSNECQTSEEMISKAKDSKKRTYIPSASTSSTTETKEEGDDGGTKERAKVTSHQYILRAGKTVNYSHHSLHFSTPTVTVTMLLPCPHVPSPFILVPPTCLSLWRSLSLPRQMSTSLRELQTFNGAQIWCK